jgi:hypothetical protein
VSPEADKFLSRLRDRAGKGVRLFPSVYRAAFAELFPVLNADESRRRLAALLEELQCNTQVTLPKSARLYDRAGAAKLPAWVDIPRSQSPEGPLPVDPRTFPWAPELRFACDIREPRQLDILLRVQRFLSDGGRSRPMIPAKERSVQLFGEEKRLERLKNGALFGAGRLSLGLLRCYLVLPPLVFESLPAAQIARPILILENYSTYHTFVLWNYQAKVYEAIFYGHGETFDTAAAGLVEQTRSMNWNGRAFYFGDLDVKGVLIPIAASETLNSLHSSTLYPHSGCYQRLLQRAKEVSLPSMAPTSLPERCCKWLGEEISREAQAWLQRGIRLPQELVGLEQLSCREHAFALPPSEEAEIMR